MGPKVRGGYAGSLAAATICWSRVSVPTADASPRAVALTAGEPGVRSIVAVDPGDGAPTQTNPSAVTGVRGLHAASSGLIVFNAVSGSTGIPVGPPEPPLHTEVLPMASGCMYPSDISPDACTGSGHPRGYFEGTGDRSWAACVLRFPRTPPSMMLGWGEVNEDGGFDGWEGAAV